MKIAIACHHYPVASGRYVADAFRRLGHQVKTIGDSTGNQIWGMTVADKYIWTPDSSIGEFDPLWPDLVIVMDSDPDIWLHVDSRFDDFKPNSRPAIVVYGVDNHVRSYDDFVVDHYFLAHYHGATYPVDPTRADHSWLPCASDPMFTPSPIPWHEREYDVCMVGVPYPERQILTALMQHAGLKVFTATGLLYEEYRDAYWNSRISLCKSAAGDIGQRIFETGRMGCAVLTDHLRDLEDPVCNARLNLHGYAQYTHPQLALAIAQEMLAGDVAHELTRMSTDKLPPTESAKPVMSVGKASAKGMADSCWPHTWDARAQEIVNWFEGKYGKAEAVKVDNELTEKMLDTLLPTMKREDPLRVKLNGTTESAPISKPYLNLGCGRIHLPGERPMHHGFVPEDIYNGREWVNIDRSPNVGADKIFDLFSYPWPLESDSYDGALLSHICEHIPHGIKLNIAHFPETSVSKREQKFAKEMGMGVDEMFAISRNIEDLQDGWFAFFSELYRVLTPGALVHIMSPHAHSDGAVIDPTHTRHLTPTSFFHSMQPDPEAPFEYATGGIHFEQDGDVAYEIGEPYKHLTPEAHEPPDVIDAKKAQLYHLLTTQWNVVNNFYIRLKAVK